MRANHLGAAVGGGVVDDDDLGVAVPERGREGGQAPVEELGGVPGDDADAHPCAHGVSGSSRRRVAPSSSG